MKSRHPQIASNLLLFSLAALLMACSPSETPSDPASSSASLDETSSSSSIASSEVSSSTSSSAITHIDFPHNPVGVLKAGSGSGYSDNSNWAPGMCFPLADEAFANSQVYGEGGQYGGGGGQCDSPNYEYPWTDNFCESRSWTNPFCNTGQGHQGQDIRPKTCKNNTYWAVAAEAGTVTAIGTYTVTIMGSAPPHRIHRYLHLKSTSLKVSVGDEVVRGQKIGLVSNNMGSTQTTIHLHYEIRLSAQETSSDGTIYATNTFVPPYAALVDSYQRKLAGDCPVVE